MFFFFKQKTAYEMRISDWSSDVCSSDLLGAKAAGSPPGRRNGLVSLIPGPAASRNGRVRVDSASPAPDNGRPSAGVAQAGEPEPTVRHRGIAQSGSAPALRSEEHTSELQSLMRTSYAVFCLKKKKNARNKHKQMTLSH